MHNLTSSILLALFGVIIGYISNYLIAKYKARFELKNAITDIKAKYYIDLWGLCEPKISSEEERLNKYNQMKQWYEKGGGLLLSFKATNHFLGALKILEKDQKTISKKRVTDLKKHLTWIRTEMKYEVGSYSRKEAKTQLPESQEK